MIPLMIAAIVTAVAAASAAVKASQITAKASEKVAGTNAQATLGAAQKAADAQVKAALADRDARYRESELAYKSDLKALDQDIKLAKIEKNKYYDQATAEIDSIDAIDLHFSNEGLGPESPYDYGHEQHAQIGIFYGRKRSSDLSQPPCHGVHLEQGGQRSQRRRRIHHLYLQRYSLSLPIRPGRYRDLQLGPVGEGFRRLSGRGWTLLGFSRKNARARPFPLLQDGERAFRSAQNAGGEIFSRALVEVI